MRDETLDRVATRFRRDVIERDSRNVEPAEANQQAREALRDDDERLRLTHGKKLLSTVKKRVQDEYAVSFGNQALVNEIENDEWDAEVAAVIDEIEALVTS